MRHLMHAGFLLLVVAGWLLLAPSHLGGSSSYVETYGASMEPGFRAGDMAVLRAADDYAVGDVAAYHSDLLDTVVMHRIVAVEDDRYILQGDNNTWLDPDRPTEEQLIGRLAFRIPQGGIWLGRLTSPAALGLFALGLLAAGGSALGTRRRRRRETMSRHTVVARHRMSLGSLPHWGAGGALAAALSAVVGVLLAVPAWNMSPSPSSAVDAGQPQTMTFSYRTEVRPSAAYDDTVVTSPEPVFRNLAEAVDVRYSYRGGPGSIAVSAELSTAGGWRSTVPLRPPVSFEGDTHAGTVRLDLAGLENRAERAAAVTGIPASEIQVAIIPTVKVADGTVFSPTLALTMTPLQLTLAGEASSLIVRDSAPATASEQETAALSFAGRSMPVSTARSLSVALLLGALLIALVLGGLLLLGVRGSEGALIRRRYAPILIQVQPMPTPPGRPVVDVVDFATLAKLAQRYGLLVMHWSRSNVETFVVQDEGTTYRYRTGTGSTETHDVIGAETVPGVR